MEVSPSWEITSCSAIQEFPNIFMEPEGPLPCLQEPITSPYPEPGQSSPYHSVLLLKDPF
jgi:hypothetical protein